MKQWQIEWPLQNQEYILTLIDCNSLPELFDNPPVNRYLFWGLDPKKMQEKYRAQVGEDKGIEWVKYRWEFMRRNKDYIRIWEETSNLREMDGKDPQYTREYLDLIDKIASDFVEYELYDPNLSFDELIESLGFTDHDEAVVCIANNMGMGGEIVSFPYDDFRRLDVSIDFSKVNSIDSLKMAAVQTIDYYWKEFCRRNKKRRINLTDYDLILRVGDLKDRQYLTYEQIAEIIFPRDFNFRNEKANPESATRKIGQYYKKYREFVNGGFRDFQYCCRKFVQEYDESNLETTTWFFPFVSCSHAV